MTNSLSLDKETNDSTVISFASRRERYFWGMAILCIGAIYISALFHPLMWLVLASGLPSIFPFGYFFVHYSSSFRHKWMQHITQGMLFTHVIVLVSAVSLWVAFPNMRKADPSQAGLAWGTIITEVIVMELLFHFFKPKKGNN